MQNTQVHYINHKYIKLNVYVLLYTTLYNYDDAVDNNNIDMWQFEIINDLFDWILDNTLYSLLINVILTKYIFNFTKYPI